MEEAYTALYQEFLRLQALCLKQAAMLQHLMEALGQKQGLPPLSNGDFEDLMSFPVQCREDDAGVPPLSIGDSEDLVSIPVQCRKEEAAFIYPGVSARAPQMPALAPHPRGACSAQTSSMTKALDQLHLDPMWAEPRLNNCDQTMPADSPAQQEQPQTSIVAELRQAEQRWHNSQAAKSARRLWSSSFMNSEMLSQAGGLLMSGVTLQSQVCEFCHAVFPGHTTTSGEFLRHLMTHT